MSSEPSGVKYDFRALADLSQKDIPPIYNFHELLRRWQEATYQETSCLNDYLGLLHDGFRVSLLGRRHDRFEPDYTEADRLIFYLCVAERFGEKRLSPDGKDWQRVYYYPDSDSSNPENRKSAAEIRKVISQKAFDMLCARFFKIGATTSPEPNYGNGARQKFERFWLGILCSEELLDALCHFFRVVETFGSYQIMNIPEAWRENLISHNETAAKNFLLNFIKLIWVWEPPSLCGFYPSDEAREEDKKRIVRFQEKINAAKVWSVGVLDVLRRLDLISRYATSWDQAILDKLTEVALRAELHSWDSSVFGDRPVVTVGEACLAGSEAAWLLKRHEVLTAERARLEKMAELKRKAEKARAEADKLNKLLEAQKLGK